MEEIGIESSLVQAIIQDEKTVEVRLGKPRFLKIQPGDELMIREDTYSDAAIVHTLHDAARVRVTQVLYFESFSELVGSIDHERIIPGAASEQEVLDTLATFYSKKDEETFGVVALFIELL